MGVIVNLFSFSNQRRIYHIHAEIAPHTQILRFNASILKFTKQVKGEPVSFRRRVRLYCLFQLTEKKMMMRFDYVVIAVHIRKQRSIEFGIVDN